MDAREVRWPVAYRARGSRARGFQGQGARRPGRLEGQSGIQGKRLQGQGVRGQGSRGLVGQGTREPVSFKASSTLLYSICTYISQNVRPSQLAQTLDTIQRRRLAEM